MGKVGTVLAYIFYWIAAIAALVVMQLQEVSLRIAPEDGFLT